MIILLDRNSNYLLGFRSLSMTQVLRFPNAAAITKYLQKD